jgi:hypothetical protein
MADPVMRVFAEAEAAQAAHDYAALMDAAAVLRALGGTPADGQEDVADQWEAEAKANGVTRSRLGARGRALGPAYRRGVLAAGASLTIEQLFLGGQSARISLAASDGSAGIVMRVRTADGATLCEQRVREALADCVWRPDFTGRFTISVDNGGDQPARVLLLMR